MKCPYCSTGINIDWSIDDTFYEVSDEEFNRQGYEIAHGFCPECNKLIIRLAYGNIHTSIDSFLDLQTIDFEEIVYPKFSSGRILDKYIPNQYAKLFHESEQVNNISPRSSATLSRYILQMLLHQELNIRKKNLKEEIDELERRGDIPSTIITMLQVMRQVANFGAHPKKLINSNEIAEVEKGESDVMLELIIELFDYLFVKPRNQQEFLRQIEEKYGIKPQQ